jgi:hypothetical protein
MKKLYTGWDDDFDRCFNNHSFLFSLRDYDGSLLATYRLVFKRDGENIYTTPMEMGDVSRFLIPLGFSGFSREEWLALHSKKMHSL